VKKTVKSETCGVRMDVFLSENIPEMSRNALQRLLEQGMVSRNGAPVKKSEKTILNAEYEISLPDPKPAQLTAQDLKLDIVYEDDDVIVVNKPKGMVVHPAPGHSDGTLVNALLYHCGDSLSGINGEIRPGIVHRIDKDTSGLIIAAKNDRAHIGLSNQLKTHALARVYEAVVCGRIKEASGTINISIGRHPSDRKKQSTLAKKAREAITHFEVIAYYNGYTHVRCRLETGRTHQIRVHMAHIGHPILGDTVYGRKKAEKGLSGQCLHARELNFIHPITGGAIHLETPLPEYFTQILNKLTEA